MRSDVFRCGECPLESPALSSDLCGRRVCVYSASSAAAASAHNNYR